MTEYVKTDWQDEVLAGAERFEIKDNAGGAVDAFADLAQCQIVLKTGVTTQGTPVEALKLDKIEQGIYDAQASADAAAIPVKNRQGGDATDWNTGGTTNYVPGAPKLQVGNKQCVNGVATITFPVAFSARPIIIAILGAGSGFVVISTVSTTGFSCVVYVIEGATPYHIQLGSTEAVNWMAIGPT